MKTVLSAVALSSLLSASLASRDYSEQDFDRRALLAGEKRYLADQKSFGAPIPPWKSGSKPGWYYGKPCTGLSLPKWDGGDAAECWWKGIFGGPVCNGGNPWFPLPKTCHPPLIWKPSNVKTTSKTSCTTKTTSTSTKSCSTTSSASTASSATPTSSSSASSSSTSASSTSSASTSSVPTTTVTVPVVTITTATATTTSTSSSGAMVPMCTGTANTYQVAFLNYTTVATSGVYTGETVGAATNDPSYITFGMVDGVNDCFTMCDNVNGCTFINTYHDVEDDEPTGQHDPSKLKCVLFGNCVDPAVSNNNWGGQNDPNYITDSNGYCKSGACPVPSS